MSDSLGRPVENVLMTSERSVSNDATMAQMHDWDFARCMAIIADVCSSEAEYVAHLEALVRVFLRPLREQYILAEHFLRLIFLNVEELLEANTAFLQALQSDAVMAMIKPKLRRASSIMSMQQDSARALSSAVRAIVSFAPSFTRYLSFCQDYAESCRALEEVQQSETAFSRFCSDAMQNPHCDGLTLEAYLIKPIQRMCTYSRYLKELRSAVQVNSALDASLAQVSHLV